MYQYFIGYYNCKNYLWFLSYIFVICIRRIRANLFNFVKNRKMRERLSKFIEMERLTSSRLAEILGVQPSNISHILGGRNNPVSNSSEKLLLRFPKLNPDWLFSAKERFIVPRYLLPFGRQKFLNRKPIWIFSRILRPRSVRNNMTLQKNSSRPPMSKIRQRKITRPRYHPFMRISMKFRNRK